MKQMECRKAGFDCDYVAKGNTNDEVMRQAAEHGRDRHGLTMTDDLKKKVESLIHEERGSA